MRTGLGAFYIDLVATEASTNVIRLINRDPEPLSPATGIRGHPVDEPLRLWVVATGSDVLSATGTNVYITITPDGGTPGSETLIFTNNPTPTFSAGWTSSTYTAQTSPGGGADDEHVFKLVRDTDFASLDLIQIRVEAATTGTETLDESYTFTIEDTTAPAITSVQTRGLRTVRVTYDEVVRQGVGVLGDAQRVRDMSGSLTFTAPNTIDIPKGNITSADIGLTLGIARADNAVNNGNLTVASILSATSLTVSETLLTEAPNNEVIATLGIYRFVHQQPALPIIEPGFEPIVLSASQPLAVDLPLATDRGTLVDLTLQDDLSPALTYELQVVRVDDPFLNQGLVLTSQFSAEGLPNTSTRVSLWNDFIPQLNKNEDLSRDLERFIRSLDEVFQFARHDIDRLLLIKDVDQTEAGVLDVLLAHLGNPFTFTLTELEKRRLIDVLVEIYKNKGIIQGIVDVLNFLVPEVLVAMCAPPATDPGFFIQPFNDPDHTWTLGVSPLGLDTTIDPVTGAIIPGSILGPGTSFLLYAFTVCSPIVLTAEQRFRVTEIVEYMKPAHTHFVQLLEPTTGSAPVGAGWELGVGLLGVDPEDGSGRPGTKLSS